MTNEATKTFVDSPHKALQDAALTNLDYTPEIFRKFFTSPFEQYRDRVGQRFTVINRVEDAESVDGGPGEDMYLIRFKDGEEIIAWGHEVCVLDYEQCC